MTCEELIKALAERYNALSALDDDGFLAIEVDGTLVSFRKANGAVAVVARVCEMPEDAQGRVASLLLKASALMAAAGSGAFTLDESTREVSIACTLPAVRIDVDALSKTVERLVDACYDGYNACGNVKYSEQFKFDLSGDELKMTSHLTSQKIEP